MRTAYTSKLTRQTEGVSMGIFETYTSLRGRWPVRVMETLVIGGTRPIWGRVLGPSLVEDEITMRRHRILVDKAAIGVITLEQGLAEKDSQKQHFGAAMLIRAAADAAQNPNDLVTQTAVGDMAAGARLGDVSQNPYLDQNALSDAAPVLNMTAGLPVPHKPETPFIDKT